MIEAGRFALLVTLLCGSVQAQTNLPALPCSQEASLKSLNSNVTTSVDFVNRTTQTIQVYWLNGSGARVLYFQLAAGASRTQVTFVTHPWVITDLSNNCIEIFEPVSGPGVADIGTAPVTGAAILTVSPAALQFSSTAGGESPAPHLLTVTPSGSGSSNFNVTLDGGSSGSAPPSFLSVAPLSGTSPVTLTVSATPGSLQAGTYSGRILISNPADTSNTGPSTVSVNLKVDASKPQQLTVSPTMLRFNARSGAPGLLAQDLLVSNPGSGSLTFNTSATGGSSWISAITPNSAQAAPDAPVPVQVQVNTSGLAIGSYHDTIHITSAAGNIDVPVSLFISAAGPVLGVSPTGFFFHARQSAGSSAVGSVEILNLGDPGSTVKWTASLVSGSEWLNLFFPSGTVTPATPGVMLLGIAPTATQLPLGPHYALIKIVGFRRAQLAAICVRGSEY